MGAFFHDLITWDFFPLVAIAWLGVCILSPDASNLKSRWADLVRKPWAFEEDAAAESVPYYPRRLLEELARALARGAVSLLPGALAATESVARRVYAFLYAPRKPLLPLGYLIFFVFMIQFMWANAILLVSSLKTLDQLRPPSILTRYDVAAASGTMFSLVVAAVVLSEMDRDHARLSDWDEVGPAWRRLAHYLSVFLIMSALLVLAAFGLAHLQGLLGLALGLDRFADAAIWIALFALVPVNVLVSTILIHREGVKGSLWFVIALLLLLRLATWLLRAVASVLAAVLVVLLDSMVRFLWIVVSSSFLMALTPFRVILRLVAHE